MEVINVERMPAAATGMRTIVILLVSILLSAAIGLAMLITALAPASVAAPSPSCGLAVVWPVNHTSAAVCPVAIPSSACCTRLPIG